ncbi:MAG: hypothetical protein ACI9CF_001419 [Candidatus Omnitrophota bacterium]|jgi:hypothetical protein
MKQKITLLNIKTLTDLALDQASPCLSLYQPTHRCQPENQQDQIRFRNLVKDLEKTLRQKYPSADVSLLLKQFKGLADNQDFWNHTLDGLAVFGGAGLFRVFMLRRPVAELAIISNSFHTKPLRHYLQSVHRYQILGLSLNKIQLFEGDRDMLEEIDLAPGVPRTMTETLGDELTEPHSTVTSHGGIGRASTPIHHGHGTKKDTRQIDEDRFFRAIDHAVLEHHSQQSDLPLILAALPEHHHFFREVSHNPFLMKTTLDFNPDAVPIDELRKRAWQIIQPQLQMQMAALIDSFAVATSKGLGSDDLEQITKAAIGGKVATLIIEAERHITGRLKDKTGQVEFTDMSQSQEGDLLDDVGELVRKMGGRVYIMQAELMPVRTGLAATYRH